MNEVLDLKRLAADRPRDAPARGRPRHLVSRYVLPGAVLLGFAVLVGWAARQRWLPARGVTVVPVVSMRAVGRQPNASLFNAPGWIEPRPTPVLVTALAEGVVEDLLVVEGDEVSVGQPVARLIETDARLALEQAEAALVLREAEASAARARRDAAVARRNSPVHLEAALAESESDLAKALSERAALPLELREARAAARFARQQLEGKRAAAGAVARRSIQQTESELDRASAVVQRLEERGAPLEREIGALIRRRDALRGQLELKIDENRDVEETDAEVRAAEARRRQAETQLRFARLRLERMTVRAPAAGRVLELVAAPGQRVMGLAPHATYDSSTVVTLYDPKMLQVRADVRLEDVPLVATGQRVRIQTPSVSAPLEGRLLRATSRANVQKNTLEVKASIDESPPTIRPEMLVQVTFLAPDPSPSESPAEQPLRLMVPRELVERGQDGDALWVVRAGAAERRSVRLGQAETAELVEVAEGLGVTDKLIVGGRENLRDGERVRIEGER